MLPNTIHLLLSILLLARALEHAATADLDREHELLRLMSEERNQRTAANASTSTAGTLTSGLKCGGVPVMAQVQRKSGFAVRIVGGTDAVHGEQPWVVALKLGKNFFCGGSIVKEDLIVTAAHCLEDLKPSELLRLKVVAGEYNLFRDEGTEQTVAVARAVIHPQYNSKGNYNNDIALLYVQTPVQYGTYVQPVCLPHPDDDFAVGMLCVVSGWGLTEESGSVSPKLQTVKLPIIDRSACSYVLTSLEYPALDDACMCAGYPHGGQDACQGDSGGPFACKTGSGHWVLAGVVSYGIGCARAWDNTSLILNMGSPGLFARVSSLMRFVTSVTASEGCSFTGLLVTGSSGTIQFPLVKGSRYADNSICKWTISVTANKFIQIAFTMMDIENSVNCAFDYLSITSADGIRVDKVCGGVLPSALLVRSRQATVKFVSDNSVNGNGFLLTFTEVDMSTRRVGSGCGSVAKLKEVGTIDTINYPSVYTPDTECRWLILAPSDHVVQFIFEDFCLEYDKKCRYDKVSFFDDEEAKVPLATFCGCTLPANVTSRGSTMAIHFESDQENNYKGFKGRFTFIPKDLSVEPGPVKPPISVRAQVPKAVPIDVCGVAPFSCQWLSTRIVGGEEARPNCWPWQVSVRHNTLHVCGGTVINPKWILTAAHCIQDLKTDAVSVVAGDHDTCLKDTTEQVRMADLIVAHPQFDPVTYDYDIALIRLNETLVYNDFVRPVCLPRNNSALLPSTMCVVTGWGSAAEGRRFICRLQQLQLPVMDWNICNHAYFARYSDGLTERMCCAGFLTGVKDACQGDSGGPMVCQSESGAYVIHGIVSWGIGCARPNTPGVYANVSHYLDWMAKTMEAAEPGAPRSVERNPVHVQKLEPTPRTSENKSACMPQTLMSPMGSFTSPGYPLGYAGALNCVWEIPISSSSVLKLEVVHLTIEASKGCATDSLSIYELRANGMKALDTLCGAQHCKTYVSNASLVKVIFSSHKHSSVGKHGFVAQYKLYGGLRTSFFDPTPLEQPPVSLETCADVVLTNPNGTIQSPGYPNNYPHNARCEWRIIASLKSVITLYIQEFKTEETQSGCQDSLMIYEGTGEFKKLLVKLCGEVVPTAIKSEGAEITLVFISNGEVTDSGFHLTYASYGTKSAGSTAESTDHGCPVLGRVPVRALETIEIKSPFYPGTYPDKCDCQWVVYSESGKHLQCNITDFSLEDSPSCTFDSLKIYDGQSTSSRLLANLCGNEKQISLRSSDNYFTVHFQTDKSVVGRGFIGTCTAVPQQLDVAEPSGRSRTLYTCGRPLVDPMLTEECPQKRNVPSAEKGKSRVVGGWESCPSSLPWVVSIQMKSGRHICGGVLISPTFVVTAAHCSVKPSMVKILVGSTLLNPKNSSSYAFVKRLYRPGEYDEKTFPPAFDIMIVELTAPLNIDPNSIICLPDRKEQLNFSSECLISGWGGTTGNIYGASQTLQQASVSLISNEECISYWTVDVAPINICAGGQGSSSCLGDSGGPLMCMRNGTYEVVAIASWGSSKCDPNIPTVYTRVGPFLPWMDDVFSSV